MYRDECKHFCKIDTDGNGDLYFCRLACNKHCNEGPITYCKEYEETKDRRRYLKKQGMFTKEDFDI